MSSQDLSEMGASDLPIALYLNQRITFDLLAVLEDGFAHMTTIQASSGEAQGSEVQGGLGVSNVFAILGLEFGVKGKRDSSNQSGETSTEQLVHTPTSLFARLRAELSQRGLVKHIGNGSENLAEITPGDFIEFSAVLRRSPLIVVLNTFLELVPMMEAFDDSVEQQPSGSRNQQRRRNKKKPQPSNPASQVGTFLKTISDSASEDLIAECGSHRFVLVTEPAYFVDPSMNGIVDGTFKTFGKVARVVPDGSDKGIGLLRKSPIGNFRGLAQQMEVAFGSLAESGLEGPEIVIEIPPPTLQIIPIAIFA